MNFHGTAMVMEKLTLWCMEDDGSTNHTGLVSDSTEDFNVLSSCHSSLTAGITTKLAGEIPNGQTTLVLIPL